MTGPAIPAAAFKDVLGRFPSGVTVLSTLVGGESQAMTASSLTSVSLDPPLVLFCVERRASFHDAVLAAGVFGVSVLAEHQSAVSDRFAGRAPHADRQIAGTPHHHGPATGVALLDDAAATLECRTWATYPGGDHTIVVGRVLAVAAPSEAPLPLAYWRGRYRTLNPQDACVRPRNPDAPR